MAITLNIGGSKKVSQNYDSQGVSLNITAEVPNDALTDPQKIADTAHDLFGLVNGLLDEQIAKLSQTDAKASNGTTYRNGGRSQSHGSKANGNGNGHGRYSGRSRSNGHKDGTAGNGSSGGNRNPDRPLTQAQQRAITSMVKRLDEDGDAWVQHEFGVDKVADLNVRQASAFIDILKSGIDDRQPAHA